MTHEEFRNGLLEVEAKLEEIGRGICSLEGSGGAWSAINSALESVQDAIHRDFTIKFN